MTCMLMNAIKIEQRRIQRLIDLNTSGGKTRDLGSLVLDSRKNLIYCYEYFYKDGKRTGTHYLGKPGSDAVRDFCSMKYREELLRRLYKNQRLLNSIEPSYLDYDLEAVYNALPKPCLRVSSEAYIDERYEELKAWASADYQKNGAQFPKTRNYAKDGTRVRSKGEGLVYNMLMERSIPFRYDSLLRIVDKGGFSKTLSPDFMIRCYDGDCVIIEHLGWLGDKSYALDYGEKCYWYLQKGFVPGKNFLVTSDDITGGTDSAAIESVIAKAESLFWGWK